jgi:hypothetical protein
MVTGFSGKVTTDKTRLRDNGQHQKQLKHFE